MLAKFHKYWPFALLVFFFFFTPMEHKYDQLLRFYSLTLIPVGLYVPNVFDPRISFYLSDCIALILLILGMRRIRPTYQERGTLFLATLFFLAICSVITSPFGLYPVAYWRALQFLTPLALFFFMAHHPFEPKKLWRITASLLCIAGAFQGTVAILQYLLQHEIGLPFLGEHLLAFAIPAQDQIILRALGTFDHPNVLSGFLFITLLFSGYLWTISSMRNRISITFSYCLQLTALFLTYSRAALFAYLLAMIFWFVWMKWRQKTVRWSLILGVLTALMGLMALFHKPIAERGGIFNYNNTAQQSDAIRLCYHRVALRMMAHHPWTGVGYGQFTSQAPHYFLAEDPPAIQRDTFVHNIFLLIGAEMGLPALFCFLAWMGWIVYRLFRSPYAPEIGFGLSLLAGLFFIGCCDFYLVVSQPLKILFFGIMGLLMHRSFVNDSPSCMV